ncbi:MAG TPA: ABC transporter permease subunit [Candidatus Avacidaminococcus intestinavium]|uniref:ABC transporter permease subunit n=1 Tax=Candidatus Avacidaminococcus intestinavium TaxID=2840684 RepID=A0A9D1MP12_9FIRM|nr:ABC transporter permease subunit [Candidatus Avacidaminococcus intestinavium]
MEVESTMRSFVYKKLDWQAFLLKILLLSFAFIFIIGPLSSLMIWSLAREWFWPNSLPTVWGLYYWERALTGDIIQSFILSFWLAIAVTVICLVITVPVAYLIARRKLPMQAVFMAIFLIPQAFPQLPVYTNTMTLMYKWNLVGTVSGVLLIQLVGAIVYSVWTLVSVFRNIQPYMEEASFILGAGALKTFFKISLPMALPGIISAGLLVFLFALDEFTGSLLIGAPFIVTAPIYMYNAANGYEMQIASVIAIILMLPGMLFLGLLQRYMKSEYLAAFGRL